MNLILTKKKVLWSLFIFFVSYNYVLAKPISKDTLQCLEITGMVTKNEKPQTDAVIKLWYENEVIATIDIKKQYKFKFILNKGCVYTIEVSKPGFVTRLISICTHLPTDLVVDNIYRFNFEMELIEEKKNIDSYYKDFPAACISYDPKIDAFLSDIKYSGIIKKSIFKR